MTHYSEDCYPLKIRQIEICNPHELIALTKNFGEVCVIVLPSDQDLSINEFSESINQVSKSLDQNATLITVGEPIGLAHTHMNISRLTYQLWIAIKRKNIKHSVSRNSLPQNHFGALIHTGYEGTLKHTTTRIQYTFCPACDKTTKDYGGKKHTYNSYGTLISDIWRDIACDLESDLTEVMQRFADLFGIETYKELRVLDCRKLWQLTERIAEKPEVPYTAKAIPFKRDKVVDPINRLLQGDCLENLGSLANDSVDFAFIDPPYNLSKHYNNYSDDLSIQEYFAWCDKWIGEVARVLRPGRTLAILNIPLWAIRHFFFMETILEFQNWIAWDALSFPVRKIMPAHYSIVCFSKGPARSLPGLISRSGSFPVNNKTDPFAPLEPLEEAYCLRSSCLRKRNAVEVTDRGQLTDLWWDIHRLKHNSRRVDHPCQLPPQLLYRLISVFTEPGETVLDCFNGAGTTTLTADQMDRRYIGIELSEKYHQIACSRHEEIQQGLDPFRKVDRKLTEKNSPVPRMPKQTYEVPKKTLQLEVRRVANQLNRLPSRADMIQYGNYPIRYYDEYFASWGEVCAAARHDGMTETRDSNQKERAHGSSFQQLSLFTRGLTDAKR